MLADTPITKLRSEQSVCDAMYALCMHMPVVTEAVR